jgi:fumarate reductase flavoprotein subunit
MEFGGYRGNQRVVKTWADNCDQAMDWLLDIADEYNIQVVLDMTTKDWYFPNYPLIHVFQPKKQETLCEMLLKKGRSLGAEYYFDTPAVRLIRKGKGPVTGVIAQNKQGEYLRFNARKAVVLATGDYGHDREMVAKYCPWDGINEIKCAYPDDVNTGDGHKMGMWIGAAIDDIPHCPNIFDWASFSNKGLFNVARQPWLYVNTQGERFMNEDLPWGYECNQILQQPGRVAWSIWDSKYDEAIPIMHSQCCKNIGPPTFLWNPNQLAEALANGGVLKADSLEELGKKIGVPADTFKATFTRYNDLAGHGHDLDFGKHRDRLFTLQKPPFYACQMEVRYLVILSGLKINTRLQVLDTAGVAIPRLYASGNVSGSFFGGNSYSTTTPGVTHSRAWTFGRMAGQAAAAEKG